MARITLYGPRGVPFTLKVERALRMKKLPYTVVEPQGPEDYRRWNPETGLLPLLEVDDERVHDSTRIVVRLDELFPEPPILSTDPKLADAQRRLEEWCDETFFFYWLRWDRLQKQEAERPPRPFGLLAWLKDLALGRGPVVRPRSRDGLSPEALDLVDQIGRRCDDLLNLLGGRPFFYGDSPSLADLAVSAMLEAMRQGNLPRGPQLILERPPLAAYMKRVAEATGGRD